MGVTRARRPFLAERPVGAIETFGDGCLDFVGAVLDQEPEGFGDLV